eukprot:1194185-Rhodomonas_salina.1
MVLSCSDRHPFSPTRRNITLALVHVVSVWVKPERPAQFVAAPTTPTVGIPNFSHATRMPHSCRHHLPLQSPLTGNRYDLTNVEPGPHACAPALHREIIQDPTRVMSSGRHHGPPSRGQRRRYRALSVSVEAPALQIPAHIILAVSSERSMFGVSGDRGWNLAIVIPHEWR